MLIRNCYVDSRWVVKLSDYYVDEVLRPFLQNGTIELAYTLNSCGNFFQAFDNKFFILRFQ